MLNALPFSNAAKAQLFYVAYYGRPADPLGLAFWSQTIGAVGGNLSSVTTQFGTSAEAQAIYGSLPVSLAVNALYRQMFDRDAEPAGIAWWTARINEGTVRLSDLPIELYQGAQGTDLLAIQNKLNAADAFTSQLDTNAEVLAYNGLLAMVPVKQWLATVGASSLSLLTALGEVPELIESLLPDQPEPPAPPPAQPTFSLTASAPLVNEGQTVFFTLDTDNVAAGSQFAYTISGIEASDVVGGVLAGMTTVGSDGRAIIAVSLANDATTEGAQAMVLSVAGKSAFVAVNDTSVDPLTPPPPPPPGTPTYALSASSAEVDEGDAVTFTLTTTNVAPGSQFAYAISGVGSADVAGGILSGLATVGVDGRALITVALNDDLATEGNEALTLSVAGQTSTVLVNDTSTTPVNPGTPTPTYTLTAVTPVVNEGSSAIFQLQTTNVPAGSQLAYALSGVSQSDVVGGALAGMATVGVDGTAVISVPLANDLTTEGVEALGLTIAGRTATVVVNDTSTNAVTPPPATPTYLLTASTATVAEGSSVIFTLQTTNVAAGSQFAYAITGVDATDVVGGQLSGLATVGADGRAYVTVSLAEDAKTEGAEGMALAVAGQTSTVIVSDTSIAPVTPTPGPWPEFPVSPVHPIHPHQPMTYALAPASLVVEEGGAAIFTLTTTNVKPGSQFAYYVGGVDPSDVLGGVLAGVATIGTDGKAVIAIGLVNDETTEGDETLSLYVAGQAASVTVRDESVDPADPTYELTAADESVNEGSTTYFELTTTNVAPGSEFAYVISGVSAADVVGGSLTGVAEVGADGRALIEVQLVADAKTEGEETLTVSVAGETASTLVNDTSMDPAKYALTAEALPVNEGNSGSKSLVFTLTLDRPATEAVTVNYATSNGTAQTPSDYQQASGTVTFAVGQQQASLNVTVYGDTKFEDDETVNVSFSGSQLAAPASATGTITNDDIVPPTSVLSVDTTAVNEGDTVTFTLTTTGIPVGTAVPWTIQGVSSADLGGAPLFGTAIIGADGKAVVTVEIANDLSQPALGHAPDWDHEDDPMSEGPETLTFLMDSQFVTVGITDTSTAVIELTPNQDTLRLLVPGTYHTVHGEANYGGGPNDTFTQFDTILGNGNTIFNLDIRTYTTLPVYTLPLSTISGLDELNISRPLGNAAAGAYLPAYDWSDIGSINLVANDATSEFGVQIGGQAPDDTLEIGTDLRVGPGVLGGLSAFYATGYNVAIAAAQGVDDDETEITYTFGDLGPFADALDVPAGDITGVANAGGSLVVDVRNANGPDGFFTTDDLPVDVVVGNVSLTNARGEGERVDVAILQEGDDTSPATRNEAGDLMVGNVEVLGFNSIDIEIANTAGGAEDGSDQDVTVGNVSILVNRGGEMGSVEPFPLYTGEDGFGLEIINEGYTDVGDLTVGDISIELERAADGNVYTVGSALVFLGGRHDSDSPTTDTDNQDAVVGDLTIGNVDLTLGTDAIFDFLAVAAISVMDGRGTLGDVTVGNLTIQQGIDSDLRVGIDAWAIIGEDSPTPTGTGDGSADIGNITLGDVDISMFDGASFNTFSDTNVVYVSAEEGEIGNITLGNLTLTAGVAARANLYFGFTAGSGDDGTGNIGNFTRGDISLTLDHDSWAFASDWMSASGDIGNVTVGDISIQVSDDFGLPGDGSGTEVFAMYNIDVDAGGDVGDVKIGNSVGASAEGEFDMDFSFGDNITILDTPSFDASVVDVHGDSIGSIALGSLRAVAGESDDIELLFHFSAEDGSIESFERGNIVMEAGINSQLYGEDELDATNSVGNVTVGNITLSADTGGLALYELALDVDQVNGDVIVGDYSLTLSDDVGVVDTHAVRVDANGDDSMDDVVLGDLTVTIGEGNDVDVHFEFDVEDTFDDFTRGDVTLTAGSDSSLFGEDDIYVENYGIGDVEVGNVTVNAGTNSDSEYELYVEVGDDDDGHVGSVTVGNVDLNGAEGGGAAIISIDIEGDSIGDITVGTMSVDFAGDTVLDRSFMNIDANDENLGAVTLGDLSVTTMASDDIDIAFDFDVDDTFESFTRGTVTLGAGSDSDLLVEDLIDADDWMGPVSVGAVGTMAGSGVGISVSAGAGANATYALNITGSSLERVASIDIGNVMLTGTSDGVALIEIDVTSESIGNVTIGSITATYGDQLFTGNVDITHTLIDISATNGSLGDVTVGDLSVTVGVSDEVDFALYYRAVDGSMGDFIRGDVTLVAGSDSELTIEEWIWSSYDDVGTVGLGNLSSTAGAGATALYEFFVTAGTEIDEGDIGNVTVGDVSASAMNGGSDDLDYLGAVISLNFGISATTGSQYMDDIGDLEVGNVAISAGGSDADALFELNIVGQGAGSVIGTLDVGDVTMSVSGYDALASLQVHVTSADAVGTMTFGNFDLSLGNGSDDVGAVLEIDIDNTSGTGVRAADGDIVLGDIAIHGDTVRDDEGDAMSYSLAFSVDAYGDIRVGDITVTGGDGLADNFAVFGSNHTVFQTFFPPAPDWPYPGNAADDWFDVDAVGTITVGNIDYSGYGNGDTGVLIDVSGFLGASSITGSAGDDILVDNTGTNTLVGGEGADYFVILGAGDRLDGGLSLATMDRIVGFSDNNFGDGDKIAVLESWNLVLDEYEEASFATFSAFKTAALAAQDDVFVGLIGGGVGLVAAIDSDNDNTVDFMIHLVGTTSLSQVDIDSFITYPDSLV